MEKNEDFQSFNPDRPIDSASKDTLGRRDFAEALARRIAAWQNRDSLVLALYGPWGSGKSSVKNLIKEHLHKIDADIPVVEFNPWHVSGQEQLITTFFEEVGKAIPSDGYAEGKVRASLWKEYGGHFATASKIAHALKYAAPLLPVPGVGVLLEQLSKALSEAATLAGEGTRAAAVEQSLDELKKALAEELAKLPRPILIVIDDIDRLEEEEIRQLFRVVKGNADFPNFVYLLLFQRDLVEKALANTNEEEGRLYLEKIVQVGLPLPEPPLNNIHNTLFGGINRILGLLKEDIQSIWDKERWANLWIAGLSHYFSNLRRVYRYLNSLDFMFAVLGRQQTLEVNPMDLVALECLRVFEPSVYAAVSKAKRLLTKTNAQNSERDAVKKEFETILEQAANKKAVKVIASDLFPEVSSNMSYGSSYLRRWKAERRVCCIDFFDRYFQLALAEGQVSESEIQSIMTLTGNRDELRTRFRAFICNGTLTAALQRLEAEDTLDIQDKALPYLLAWSDVADEFPTDKISIGMISVSPSQYIRWAVFRVFENANDPDAKLALAKELIAGSDGLLIPVEMLDLIIRKNTEDSFFPKLDSETMETLRSHCLRKLSSAAQSGILITHPELSTLLYCWYKWDPSATKSQCENWLECSDDAERLLLSMVRRGASQSWGSYYVKNKTFIDLGQLEQFASLENWKSAINNIQTGEESSEELRNAIAAFGNAVTQREQGLPDQTWGSDE